MVRIVRSYLSYSWVLLSLLVLAPLAALCLPYKRVHDWLAVFWAWMTIRIGGASMVAEGIENVNPDENYVIVANHQSIIDIPVLTIALMPRASVRFMAKRPIFLVPVLGWAMWAFGHVPVDRSSARRSLPGLKKAQARLRTRFSFIFFPEGTRTSTGKMGPFKAAAFKMAARAGVKVLPVTLVGAFEAVPKWTVLFQQGAKPVRVKIHPPIAPTGEGAAAANALAAEAHRVIEQGLPPEQQVAGDHKAVDG
jgi:1-acyl-sn-glycerol-3-phosphate acyltransferase